jgi:hypothetical protein
LTLIEELKTLIEAGSVKAVVLFADGLQPPAPPYVVIKPEPHAPDKQKFTCYVHFIEGQLEAAETYIKSELYALVSISRNSCGQRKFKSDRTWVGPMVEQGSDTLVYMRSFWVPLIIG